MHSSACSPVMCSRKAVQRRTATTPHKLVQITCLPLQDEKPAVKAAPAKAAAKKEESSEEESSDEESSEGEWHVAVSSCTGFFGGGCCAGYALRFTHIVSDVHSTACGCRDLGT